MPFESTRHILNGMANDSAGSPGEGETFDVTRDESQDIKPDIRRSDESINNAEMSLDESMSSEVKDRDRFKDDFNVLNNR